MRAALEVPGIINSIEKGLPKKHSKVFQKLYKM